MLSQPLGEATPDGGGLIQRKGEGPRVFRGPEFRALRAVEEKDVVAEREPDVAAERAGRSQERDEDFVAAGRERGHSVTCDHELDGFAGDPRPSCDRAALVDQWKDEERIERAPGPRDPGLGGNEMRRYRRHAETPEPDHAALMIEVHAWPFTQLRRCFVRAPISPGRDCGDLGRRPRHHGSIRRQHQRELSRREGWHRLRDRVDQAINRCDVGHGFPPWASGMWRRRTYLHDILLAGYVFRNIGT